ncbi:MAG: hypothetical protein K2P52_08475 [Campylobacterales bacterium]|nr:hypothetical protein [Campylobacterales bacterium]
MNEKITIGKTKEDLIKKPGKCGRPKLPVDQLVSKDDKFTCECGMIIKRSNNSQHKRCKQHKLLMNSLSDVKSNQIDCIEKDIKLMNIELDKLQMKINDEKFKLKIEYYKI